MGWLIAGGAAAVAYGFIWAMMRAAAMADDKTAQLLAEKQFVDSIEDWRRNDA